MVVGQPVMGGGDGMTALDIGDLCVCCGEDTSFGGGKFVNRIPADNVLEVVFDGPRSADLAVAGWMCEECQFGDEEDN